MRTLRINKKSVKNNKFLKLSELNLRHILSARNYKPPPNKLQKTSFLITLKKVKINFTLPTLGNFDTFLGNVLLNEDVDPKDSRISKF